MAFVKTSQCILIALLSGARSITAIEQPTLFEDLPELPTFKPIDQVPDVQPPSSKFGYWQGFGASLYNRHWAGKDAVAKINNIATLDLHCKIAYDPGVSAGPLLEDGIAYYPTWSGLFVALDYQNCKTLWQLNVTELILSKAGNVNAIVAASGALASRSTPVTDGDVLYIGTLVGAMVVAVDKGSGRVIDSLAIGRHPLSILSQSPTLYKGRLLIGVSTTESGLPAADPTHKLDHHGSMNALALKNGRLTLLWTTHMIPPGANYSGASVWGSQPSIDPIRQQVFIGTGQLYSVPPEVEECQTANKNLAATKEHLVNEPCMPLNVYQTSILALDIASGRINWFKTLGPLDAWNTACIPGLVNPGADPTLGPNCPKNIGNDTDFGMAPAFVLGSDSTPYGLDVVVAAQKSGNIYAFSAQTGTVMWAKAPIPGGLEGGMSWGVAVDDSTVYYTGINSNRHEFTLPNGDKITNSAWGAVSLKNGSMLWQTATPRNTSTVVAPQVVNDLVLTGVSGDWQEGAPRPVGSGSLVALNKRTGEIVREIPLDYYFRGNIAIVHDYVLFGTGYGGLAKPDKGTFQAWNLKSAESGRK